MNTVWVLVCDAAKARFFEVHDGDPTWQVVSELSHEASRSKAAGLVSDKAGRSSAEGGSVHHNALAPASSPKEVQKAHFAHTLGKVLDQAMRSSRFYRWILVAPPHFVGLLEKELTSELKKHQLPSVDKEMTHLSINDLTEKLRPAIAIPLDEREGGTRPSTKHSH